MARRAARRGLTRIEVVVLLAGVTLVATLAWPWLFIHRHPTGRNQCSRNLWTISMALQSYHDVFRVLPRGAMHAGDHRAGVMEQHDGHILMPSYVGMSNTMIVAEPSDC